MSKTKLSKRAEKVLEWVHRHTGLDPVSSTGSRLGGRDDSVTLSIRQQTLADLLGCSRRSIYRALKQLKEQGYLVETKRREKRCKVYRIDLSCQRTNRWDDKIQLTPEAEAHLKLFRSIFESNFSHWPDWEKFYPEATYKVDGSGHRDKYWRLTFDNLYLIWERETGEPSWGRQNEDSTLFSTSYPNKPPATQIDYILRTRPAYRPYRPAAILSSRARVPYRV